MPGYSAKAQPYLDAIAAAIFSSQQIRNWIIKGTSVESKYIGSSVLTDDQKRVRWSKVPTKQPYWANYWCGRDSRCECRIENSKSVESDAIFFFRAANGNTLAVHVEFKHTAEPFSFGQPEAYPLRAACFAKTHQSRRTLNTHEDWTTVIFCSAETLSDKRLASFSRVITHAEASMNIEGWPKQ